MPTINLPLVKGSGVSKNAKYIDRLAVNLYTIPRDTGNDSHYLRSFPGLTQSGIANGISYAAEYNDVTQKEYRLIGSELYEDGVSIQGGLSPQLSNTCHTASNQAFVSGGKIKYWKEGKLYELENWKEGENFVSYPDYKFIVNFNGSKGIKIPDFIVDGDSIFSANLDSTLGADFNLLYGSKKVNNDNFTYQLFFDKSEGKIFEIISANSIELRKDELAELTTESLVVNVTVNSVVNDDVIIPIQRVGGADGKFITGTIEEFSLVPLGGGVIPQYYSTIKEVERETEVKPATPTDNTITNTLDTSMKATLDSGMTWKDYKEQGEPTKSTATTYELSNFIDVDRFGSRFVCLTKDNFIATAISIGANGDEDTDFEHRPDFGGALIVQRSDPDKNMAIRAYQGKYVAVFGRNTVEFFVLSGDVNSVFSPVPNLTSSVGIVSTGAVCHFMGVFAGIGSTKGGSLQVMLIHPGSHKKISTADIDRTLMKYKESELSNALVESFLMENHEFLIVHLPNETLLYDGSTGNWSNLSTGYGRNRGVYQGKHVIYNPKVGFTCHAGESISLLDDSISSQNGEVQEFIAYSPMVEAVKGRGMVPMFGLTFDTIPGHVNQIQTAFISSSYDGYTFGEQELRLQYNNPDEYMNKIVIDSLGAVQHNIAFKLRITSSDPVAMSDFSVRLGYE